jgi:hypothetical protein
LARILSRCAAKSQGRCLGGVVAAVVVDRQGREAAVAEEIVDLHR